MYVGGMTWCGLGCESRCVHMRAGRWVLTEIVWLCLLCTACAPADGGAWQLHAAAAGCAVRKRIFTRTVDGERTQVERCDECAGAECTCLLDGVLCIVYSMRELCVHCELHIVFVLSISALGYG